MIDSGATCALLFCEVLWAKREYSKSKVDAAGRTISNASASPQDREEALRTLNNWRSIHSLPLNSIQMHVRNTVKRAQLNSTTAQRLKRLASIEDKLCRNPNMQLSRMQDIGGCRAILGTVEDVRRITQLLHSSRSQQELVSSKDYISEPKADGYRGIHVVYRYRSSAQHDYDGLRIEVQLRTEQQHYWATAVETVDRLTGQSLKTGRGNDAWEHFFALMGSVIAVYESTPLVPGTANTPQEIRKAVRASVNKLDVFRKMTAFKRAVTFHTQLSIHLPATTEYYILSFRKDKRIKVESFGKEHERAIEAYGLLERDPDIDAVLVSGQSVDEIKRAYPNYFANVDAFLDLLQGAVGRDWKPGDSV